MSLQNCPSCHQQVSPVLIAEPNSSISGEREKALRWDLPRFVASSSFCLQEISKKSLS